MTSADQTPATPEIEWPDEIWVASIPNAAYIAGLEAALRNIRELNTAEPDGEGLRWVHSDLIDQEVLAALASRHPAPDVRVVTVAQLRRWLAYAEDGIVSAPIKEIRAVIGDTKK